MNNNNAFSGLTVNLNKIKDFSNYLQADLKSIDYIISEFVEIAKKSIESIKSLNFKDE